MNRNKIVTLRRLAVLTMIALATAEVWQDEVANSAQESHPADNTAVLQAAQQRSPSPDSLRDNEPF